MVQYKRVYTFTEHITYMCKSPEQVHVVGLVNGTATGSAETRAFISRTADFTEVASEVLKQYRCKAIHKYSQGDIFANLSYYESSCAELECHDRNG